MTARLLALGLALAAGTLSAQDQGIGRYVPPSPAPGGFIHDGGPVLAPADLEQLNQRIDAHQSAGLGDIAVAILRDIGDYPAYEAGTAIYRAWGIGSQAAIGSDRRDLGVLLLIVPKELAPSGMGDCWITTGLGAEAHLTDGEAAAICRDRVIPRLREQDYAGAVGEGITGIAAALASLEPMSAVADPVPSEDSGGVPGPLVALLALGGAGGGVVAWRRHRRRKPRPCPAGHGAMRLLDEKADDAGLVEGQRKEESLKSVDYDVWQCPVCDERLVLRYKRWFTAYSQCPQCEFWTVKSRTRTLVAATTSSGGLAETTRTCLQCKFTDTRQHATAKLSSSSSSSSGGSSSSGRSFGGSGRSGGGGGGARY